MAAGPLEGWSVPHKRALAIAAAAGGLAGFIYGAGRSSPIFGDGLNFGDCRTIAAWLVHDYCNSYSHDWTLLVIGPICGAAFAGLGIVIWRLMLLGGRAAQ